MTSPRSFSMGPQTHLSAAKGDQKALLKVQHRPDSSRILDGKEESSVPNFLQWVHRHSCMIRSEHQSILPLSGPELEKGLFLFSRLSQLGLLR